MCSVTDFIRTFCYDIVYSLCTDAVTVSVNQDSAAFSDSGDEFERICQYQRYTSTCTMVTVKIKGNTCMWSTDSIATILFTSHD